MTGPVATDDLVTGLLKYMLAQPDVVAVVGKDPVSLTPYLFAYNNWVTLEKTQSTCAIFNSEGGWAGPNTYNTLRFPRISLSVWVDPIRDAGNNVIDPGEAMRRANAAYEAIDKHLHRAEGDTQMWGSVRTVASVRLTEPLVYKLSDGDGMVRLQASYAITQG